MTTKITISEYNATIIEQGNGLPDAGEYCSGGGSLYRVIRTSRIHTGDRPGAGNYVYAEVELADYADCSEEDEHTALVRLDANEVA